MKNVKSTTTIAEPVDQKVQIFLDWDTFVDLRELLEDVSHFSGMKLEDFQGRIFGVYGERIKSDPKNANMYLDDLALLNQLLLSLSHRHGLCCEILFDTKEQLN